MSSFFFVDDSGSKQWDTPYSRDFVDAPPARTAQNRQFWQDNYFVLAGIYIDHALVAKLNPVINAKKVEVFGTKHAEIRSVNLRNPQKRKKYYLDKFGITEDQLKDFIENFWYRIFEDNKNAIQIQAIVLDKRYYKNPRVVSMPLEIASQVMFDRIELTPNKQCEIVFDQMDHQVKTDKRDHGKILHIADKTIDLGSWQTKYSHTSVGFEESKNSNFLQLADTAAYNILRQFVDHGDRWDESGKGALPMYTYFERISDNFYCQSTSKQVRGYGIIKIPDVAKVKWRKNP